METVPIIYIYIPISDHGRIVPVAVHAYVALLFALLCEHAFNLAYPSKSRFL